MVASVAKTLAIQKLFAVRSPRHGNTVCHPRLPTDSGLVNRANPLGQIPGIPVERTALGYQIAIPPGHPFARGGEKKERSVIYVPVLPHVTIPAM